MASLHQPNRDPQREQKFQSDLEFEDPGIGKIIIYSDDRNVQHLAGKEIDSLGFQIVRYVEGKSENEIAEFLSDLIKRPAFIKNAGYHKDIPHNGNILGGATALLLNSHLYVIGKSKDFDEIPQDAVRKSLSGTGITAVFLNLVY